MLPSFVNCSFLPTTTAFLLCSRVPNLSKGFKFGSMLFFLKTRSSKFCPESPRRMEKLESSGKSIKPPGMENSSNPLVLSGNSSSDSNQALLFKQENNLQASECEFVILSGKSYSENNHALLLKHNKILKLSQGEVVILVHSELQEECATQTFRTELYMNTLSTVQFGRFLVWSPRLSSTHELVSQNFSDLPLGTVCVADIQLKGKGRGKNVWESPAGCLLFSFTLQMDNGHILPLLQYVVSLAMTEAVNDVCGANGLPHINVKIKWPNDLYIDGLKVGGVLCTSTYTSKKFNVCAGIGLNVDNDRPSTCLNSVLKGLTSGSQSLRREDILAAFFKRFETFFDVFLNQGFQALEKLYYKTWLHSLQKVIIEEKNEGNSPENIPVTIQGLTSSGYLLAVDDNNISYELHPDGNSFDFFKGLVRKKLN